MIVPLTFENAESRADNPQELVNMMVEAEEEGAKSSYTLIGTPGLLLYKDTGDARESRGGYLLEDGSLLTVMGSTVYKVTSAGTQSTIGTLSTSSGPVLFTENPTQVMLVDGGTTGYVYTISTSTMATVVSAVTPESITFQDSYGVASENTGLGAKIFYSAVNDLSSWGTLDFVVSDSLPDPIIGVFSNHNEVWALREKSAEAYFISASDPSVLVPRSGTVMEVGCSSQFSIALGDGALFWLDDNGLVRMAVGYTPHIISTRNLEREIIGEDWSAAKGYSYVQEGHTFYVLIIGDLCWCYDMSTKKWHKRQGLATPWAAAWVHQRGELILAGDRSNGKVYQLSTTTYTDDSGPIRWTATTNEIQNDRKRINHKRIELHMKTGLGDGQVTMDYSDDGGYTWSNGDIEEYGPIGKYNKRLKWNRKGQSRNRIYRFIGTSSLERKLISAHMEGEALGI